MSTNGTDMTNGGGTQPTHAIQRIIVIDDQVVDRRIVKSVLSRIGFVGSVDEYTCGRSFLEAVERDGGLMGRQPTLVLIDINMPMVSGFDVLKGLAAFDIPNSYSIVMFSSSCRDKDVRDALTLGAHRYQPKPMSLGAYKEVLSRLIHHPPSQASESPYEFA